MKVETKEAFKYLYANFETNNSGYLLLQVQLMYSKV